MTPALIITGMSAEDAVEIMVKGALVIRVRDRGKIEMKKKKSPGGRFVQTNLQKTFWFLLGFAKTFSFPKRKGIGIELPSRFPHNRLATCRTGPGYATPAD